jgi:hypothetical protein
MLAMANEPNDPSGVPSIDSPSRPASMLTRPTLKRPDRSPDQDDLPPTKGQTRPIEQRFLLKVDGQFKRSFGSEEAAKTAGTAIKKVYPVVVVTVVDSQGHNTEIIKV